MKYEIKGTTTPVVVCTLEAGETLKNQAGAMVWMSPNMKMSTNAGGSKGGGLLKGLASAASRLATGEGLFQNQYTAEGGPGLIAFGSSCPGSIVAVNVTPDKPIICQKSAFLAAEAGIELSVHFQKKLGSGFFGGEGFIMQKISGNGIVFLEIDGDSVEYELAAGQTMLIDTGYLAMMDSTCTMDIKKVEGIKNILAGGEGLFNTEVAGPGKIILQTMPLSQFASSLIPYLPTSSS